MKDLTGEDLSVGDFVIEMRTGKYGWFSLGVIEGTKTNSGRIKFFNIWEGLLSSAQETCLLKITKEDFERKYSMLLYKYRMETMYHKLLEDGYKKVMEYHNLYPEEI